MGDEAMNKKGAIVLRDIMFMLITFSAVMALASVFVLDMANEYSNSEMITQYYADDSVGDLGDTVFVNVNSSIATMREKTESSVDSDDSLLGSFTSVTGVIQGAAAILKAVITSPVYVGNALTTMMTALRLPNPIPSIIGNTAIFFIYVIIIFVIVSAFLKGGKV
jgi:hypothetical protein